MQQGDGMDEGAGLTTWQGVSPLEEPDTGMAICQCAKYSQWPLEILQRYYI